MWNLKDSNVKVGLFMKVEKYKKHLQKVINTKSNLNVRATKPWQPSFSLSRNKNRYHKSKTQQIDNENGHLMRKLVDIDQSPKIKTLLDVPIYIPSNKQNYKFFKLRERSVKSREISKENITISMKITSASKSYQKSALQRDWQTSRVYKKNISKVQKCHDLRSLAISRIRNSRKTQNPSSKDHQTNSIVNYQKLYNRSQLFKRKGDKFKKII